MVASVLVGAVWYWITTLSFKVEDMLARSGDTFEVWTTLAVATTKIRTRTMALVPPQAALRVVFFRTVSGGSFSIPQAHAFALGVV
jgi:hypothetical protein